MSTTATASPAPGSAIVHLTRAPEGILRLFVPDGFDVSKGTLIALARKLAGTIDVGRVPAGKPHTVKGVHGVVHDFAPVVHRNVNGSPAVAAPVADDPRLSALLALGIPRETAVAALAGTVDTFADQRTAAKGKTSAKGKGKGTDAKGDAFREFLASKREAKDAAAKTCPRCLGFGRERLTPRLRKDGTEAPYPYAFRTQAGADGAISYRPCSDAAHHGRKGKGKTA
jgi:hypothetical protein